MTTVVALLRGINVGGRTKVAMADLRALCTDLGLADVVTYIQSGNVVFRSAKKPDTIARGLEERIRAELGLEVTVVVRTAAELAKAVRGNPYVRTERDTQRLHVLFMDKTPARTRVAALDPDRSPPDEFTVRGREIFLRLPHGFGRSKLTVDWFERQLGVRVTARNWTTVNKLLELSRA